MAGLQDAIEGRNVWMDSRDWDPGQPQGTHEGFPLRDKGTNPGLLYRDDLHELGEGVAGDAEVEAAW